MMKIVDLHVHSNKSDGSLTPSQLVDLAVEKRLSAFALTDHDTTDGIPEALKAAEEHNQRLAAGLLSSETDNHPPLPLEVIPGIELSTEYRKRDVHILGLYIDYQAAFFQEWLQHFVDSRIQRNHKLCANLQTAKIDITYEKLQETFPCATITRSHYARYLLDHGYVKSLLEAFDRYLGDHTRYFVPREKVTPEQAVELILQAGGIPILAHPILYRFSDTVLETLVADLKNIGLIGIETIYSTYSPAEEQQIRTLAAKYDLCISGGSDFHGANKPGLEMATGYGRLIVPEEVLTNLKKRHSGQTQMS